MILLPNATGQDNGWFTEGESTAHECLDDDNEYVSYVKCSTGSSELHLEFANPSVVEADIASITSVRFLSIGKSNHRAASSAVSVYYDVPFGNPAQPCLYDAHRTDWETINGSAKSYSDGLGGTAWTYSDLEDLEMHILKVVTIELYLTYFAMEVTYVEASAADNATFFGANF